MHHHGHRDFRIVRGCESDDPGVDGSVILPNLCGTGLHCHMHAVNRQFGILLGDYGLHHLRELVGGVGTERSRHHLRLGLRDDRQIRGAYTVDQRRLHQLAVIGDGRRNQGVLQRGDHRISLSDRCQRKFVVTHISREFRSHGHPRGTGRIGAVHGDRTVETKLLGHRRDLIVTQRDAQLREGGVRRIRHRVFQRNLAVGAVALRSGVRQLHCGAGKRIAGTGGNLRIGLVLAGFQRGGRDHRLERGAGRVQLRSGAVEHRIRLVGRERVVVLVHFRRGVAGQLVRIIARRTHHGENTTGLRFDGHGRAVKRPQGVIGSLLDLRIDGGLDGGALVLLTGKQRFETLPEQLVGLPRQQ